jgi:hypothetical protein
VLTMVALRATMDEIAQAGDSRAPE